jgi:HEAT repeat protein
METTEINQLIRHLADIQTPLAVAQLYQLSDLAGERLERFCQAWPQILAERRRQIIGFLIEIAESNFEVDFDPIFWACIDDADEEVRARSVEGLWESEDESLVAPLLELAQHDPAVRVRAAAAGALGRFILLGELSHSTSQHQTAIEETLFALIRSPNESVKVRRRAVEALAYSSRKEVPGIIEASYYDDERLMRVTAVFAMGRNLDPQWEPLLLDELQSHDPELRYEAARACGELELASAVPRLAQLLTDENREIQETCIWALGQIGGQQAHQILEAHYRTVPEDDEALREAIEDALSELTLANGVVQFPLYEYEVDTEDQSMDWTEDWISSVIGDQADETDLDSLDDDD